LENTLKQKCEKEIEIYLVKVRGAEQVMQQKYYTVMTGMVMRNLPEQAFKDYLKSDIGKRDWNTCINDIKKLTRNLISKIAEWGYMSEVVK